MKEQLIKLLGLDEKTTTEEQIIETVANLKAAVGEKFKESEIEKAIQAKIRESGGALSREQAREVIKGQAFENTKAKK